MTDSALGEQRTAQVPAPSGYSGATLHIALNHAEHQRRQDHALGAITDIDTLTVFMALPHGEAVPWQSLTVHQQDTVRRLPHGTFRTATRRDQVDVYRLAIRPCRVLRATIRSATACQTALHKIEMFTPFCERVIIIRRRPAMETLIEIGFWGIGLFLDHDGDLETLVAPEPYRPKRHTPAAWRFAEQAYASYLAHTHPSERTAP